VVSSFESGTEGWRGAGDFENLGTSRTNPVQGYYLRAGDRAEGVTWYFVAPTKFEGDKAGYYGGTLSYYMLAGLQSGGTPVAADYFGGADVIISGGGMSIEYRLAASGYPDPHGFKEYEIRLAPGPGWRLEGGDPASADQMQAVLEDVERVFIRGEYFNGDDYARLDEVVLAGPQ
jgi:hypothetical protein